MPSSVNTTPPLDFSERIQELQTGFVGREWLLAEVDGFLNQNRDRALVITGEPGIGKSAASARILGHLQEQGIPCAYHFCEVRKGGTLEPMPFVQSLSLQLGCVLPGFAEAIVEAVPASLTGRVDASRGTTDASVNAINIGRLILQTRSPRESFYYLVRKPLRDWARSKNLAAARSSWLTPWMSAADLTALRTSQIFSDLPRICLRRCGW